jgi:hypothetical protein
VTCSGRAEVPRSPARRGSGAEGCFGDADHRNAELGVRGHRGQAVPPGPDRRGSGAGPLVRFAWLLGRWGREAGDRGTPGGNVHIPPESPLLVLAVNLRKITSSWRCRWYARRPRAPQPQPHHLTAAPPKLRVTPLSPAAYVVIKMLTSLVLAAGAVFAVYLVGAVTNKVSMSADLWVITGLCVWIGSLLFAAFGLFIGYLLPSENVTQIIGLALTLCCFADGLFIPLSQFSPDLQTFAKFTPRYGLNQLVHYPLAGGTLEWGWILNLAVWLAIFVTGAARRLRRDTARV